MKLTTFRHIAAGTSAAALVSASAFFGASSAFAQPTPSQDATSTATETGTQNSTSKSAKPEAKTAATTPEFDLSAHEVSAEGLRDGGVAVTVKNLQADDVVEAKGEHVTAEPAFAKDGMATVVVKSDSSVEELENAGSVTFTASVTNPHNTGNEQSESFTVKIVKDEGDAAFDPKVTSAPDKITAADLADKNKGITITATNLKAGDVVANTLVDDTTTAEGDTVETKVYYGGDASDFKVGQKVDFTVSVTRGEESKTFDFTVTIVGEDDGDDETAEPELKISPEKISVTDFRNEKKGVQLTVSNCTPNETATFVIEHENGELKHEVEADVNDEGTAVIEHIHGTGDAKDSAYLGKYTVTATCGDAEAAGSFSVHADDDGKGGGDSDEGDRDSDNGDRDRDELPRTGTELTALYGAAGLLAVGGAAMMIGRRKTAKK